VSADGEGEKGTLRLGWRVIDGANEGHTGVLDMRVIFMDVAVGRWGLPSVEMETLLWRSSNRV
jgi:hypothetical protein